MSDEELLQKTSAARGLAHRTQGSKFAKGHKGDWLLVYHCDGPQIRAKDFFALSEECKRRGLKTPPCDCPKGSHP